MGISQIISSKRKRRHPEPSTKVSPTNGWLNPPIRHEMDASISWRISLFDSLYLRWYYPCCPKLQWEYHKYYHPKNSTAVWNHQPRWVQLMGGSTHYIIPWEVIVKMSFIDFLGTGTTIFLGGLFGWRTKGWWWLDYFGFGGNRHCNIFGRIV